MHSKGILITGTDTGVGKTFVGCGISAALRRRGLTIGPFKPVETGCEWDSQSQILVPADAVKLQKASETQAPLETICPYRFRTPVAPNVAAELEGIRFVVDEVRPHFAECYETLRASHDLVIVETAGGILVPITTGFHYAHLACALSLPVLLVAGSKLGVINHTLLTLSFLEHAGLRAIGCVLNHCTSERDAAIDTNAKALRDLLSVPLYVLPNAADTEHPNCAEFDSLASLVMQAVSWRS